MPVAGLVLPAVPVSPADLVVVRPHFARAHSPVLLADSSVPARYLSAPRAARDYPDTQSAEEVPDSQQPPGTGPVWQQILRSHPTSGSEEMSRSQRNCVNPS